MLLVQKIVACIVGGRRSLRYRQLVVNCRNDGLCV